MKKKRFYSIYFAFLIIWYDTDENNSCFLFIWFLGQSGAKSNISTTFDLNTSAQLGIGEVSRHQTRELDVAEPSVRDQEHTPCAAEHNPDVETENSFHVYELTQDTEVSGRESGASPEHTPAQDSAEQEEEWEDEEAEG